MDTFPRKSIAYSGGKTPSLYSYSDPKVVPFFNHKLGGKHKKDILACLCILGPTTLYSLAKYVREREVENLNYKFKDIPGKKFHVNEIRKRKDTYYKILNDRNENEESYLGLVSKGYAGHVIQGKNDFYFLTLKSCILCIGFEFGIEDFRRFIQNAGSAHIFFAYIDKVLQETSSEFVNEIFIKPIRELIARNIIKFDQNIELFFSNIAESVGNALSFKIESIHKKLMDEKRTQDLMSSPTNFAEFEEIKILMNNTWYEMPSPKHEWEQKIWNFFYPKGQINKMYLGEGLFIDISGLQLTWKVMREIHFSYYYYTNMTIPEKHQQKWPRRLNRNA